MRRRSMVPAAVTALITAASLGVGAGAYAAAARAPGSGYTTNGYTDLGTFPEPQVCHGTDPACYHDWGNFAPATNGTTCSFTPTRTGRGTPISGPPSARASTRR